MLDSVKRSLPKPSVKRPAQSRLDTVVAQTGKRQDALLLRYATGKMGVRQFEAAHLTLLEEMHTRAAILGRQRAGDPMKRTAQDELFARMVLFREREHLRKLTDDLLAGRYTDAEGNPKVSVIRSRMQMYTGRLTGTANETFAGASVGQSFTWKLGAVVEAHCPDCPELARNSPYRWDQLPTVPRGNKTKCLFRCTCRLVRSDGIEGFSG